MKLLIIISFYIFTFLLILSDIFYFGLFEVSIGIEYTFKYLVKLSLLFMYMLYIVIYIKNIRKIVLSIFLFMPVLFFYREFLEIKTFLFTFTLIEILIISNSILIIAYLFVQKKSFNYVNKLFISVITLFLVGFVSIFAHESLLSLNGFNLTYLFPLLYFLLLLELNIDKNEVVSTFINMMLISFFIFVIQNAYIGPITVYNSTINQTWMIENISMANGGLLEIVTMEALLIPIAFYFIYHKNNFKKMYTDLKYKTVLFVSFFIMLMPFVYHNRANSLMSMFFFAYYIFSKYSFTKRFLIGLVAFPILIFLLFDVVASRSFIDNGRDLDFFGATLKNLDSTTYNHLFATVANFTLFSENIIFGVGTFIGNDSYQAELFKISNMRNFLVPVLEPATYYGVFFILIYFIIVGNIYKQTNEQILRLFLLLQFLPIIGLSKFFGLYATGNLDLTKGFISLDNYAPVSIFSLFVIFYYLLSLAQYKEKNENFVRN